MFIKKGDVVWCRLYNSRRGQFYGKPWEATVLEVLGQVRYRPYRVTGWDGFDIWLDKHEIRGIFES